MPDLEDLDKRVQNVQLEIRRLEEKVRGIETYIKAALIVAVIFGVAGGWGAHVISSAQSNIVQLRNDTTRLEHRADKLSDREASLQQQIPKIKDNVSNLRQSAILDVDNSKSDAIKRLQGLKKTLAVKLKTEAASFVQETGAVRACRICFREIEGSNQCQPAHINTCSGWSTQPSWTQVFRDDTDNRSGGCKYQWELQCR